MKTPFPARPRPHGLARSGNGSGAGEAMTARMTVSWACASSSERDAQCRPIEHRRELRRQGVERQTGRLSTGDRLFEPRSERSGGGFGVDAPDLAGARHRRTVEEQRPDPPRAEFLAQYSEHAAPA